MPGQVQTFWCDEKGCMNLAQTGDPTESNLLKFKCVGCAEAAMERGESGQRRPDPGPEFKTDFGTSIEDPPPPVPPPPPEPIPADPPPSPARHLGIVVTPVRAKPAPSDTRSVYERLLNGNAGRTWLNLKTAAKDLGLEDPAILAGAIRRGEMLKYRHYSHEPFTDLEPSCEKNSATPAPSGASSSASGGMPVPAPASMTEPGDGPGAGGEAARAEAGGGVASVARASAKPKPVPSSKPGPASGSSSSKASPQHPTETPAPPAVPETVIVIKPVIDK